ncbi:MAG: sugar ABC transporter permease [Lachnospiraceae bacterium]|nr:sugar ABC transporter permease [Lachnospiraceae bacterium]
MNTETRDNRAILELIKANIRSYIMIIALIVLWLIFGILTKGVFLRPRNLSNLFRQMATTGIIAVGMTTVIICGYMDLSIGSVAGATSALVAVMVSEHGFSPIVAILAALVFGLLIGAFEGFWTAYMGVPAFIATLGGQLIFRGATLFITRSKSIKVNNPDIIFIGQGYVPLLMGVILAVAAALILVILEIRGRASKKKYGLMVPPASRSGLKLVVMTGLITVFMVLMYVYKGIPIALLILLALAMIVDFALTSTKYGNSEYAIGGNAQAARLSGINDKKIAFISFLLLGVTGAITGIVLTGRLASGTPSTGTGLELDAIAACVIGGVSLSGGKGRVWGALVGALVMASIANGMSLLSLQTYLQDWINGMVLIIAVFIDVVSSRVLSE